jgi:hypothetical protein
MQNCRGGEEEVRKRTAITKKTCDDAMDASGRALLSALHRLIVDPS